MRGRKDLLPLSSASTQCYMHLKIRNKLIKCSYATSEGWSKPNVNSAKNGAAKLHAQAKREICMELKRA